MDLKYHINNEGVVGICSATKEPCRFGGEDGNQYHYNTLQEARSAAEKRLEGDNGMIPRLTAKSALQGRTVQSTNNRVALSTIAPIDKTIQNKEEFIKNVDTKTIDEIIDFANESEVNHFLLNSEIETRKVYTENRQKLIQRGIDRKINNETLISAERDLEDYKDKTAELTEAYKESVFFKPKASSENSATA